MREAAREVANRTELDAEHSLADPVMVEPLRNALIELLETRDCSWRGNIHELLKEIGEAGRGHAVSSKDVKNACAYDLGPVIATILARSSDPAAIAERCLRQTLAVSSSAVAGAVREKAKRCPPEDKTASFHPELTLVHRGDGDLRLLELVRLLARRAARKYYDEQHKDRYHGQQPKDRSTSHS